MARCRPRVIQVCGTERVFARHAHGSSVEYHGISGSLFLLSRIDAIHKRHCLRCSLNPFHIFSGHLSLNRCFIYEFFNGSSELDILLILN